MFASNSSQVSSDATYVEDVFSAYLYTGTGTTNNINNGVDLSTKGGLVWIKSRDSTPSHNLFDTARGTTKLLVTNSTAAQATDATTLTAFNSNGFTLGADTTNFAVNRSGGYTYVSWTFRKQAKFFDIVTWTGDGVANRQISHNLGSTPGCIIVKATNNTNAWTIWHRSVNSGSAYLEFSTAAADTSTAAVANRFGNGTSYVAPTSTNFTVGANGSTNGSGITYVAYLFAHDAGGFGAAGTDNVISCGSYTGNGTAGNTVTLGYEPQWLMIKAADISDTGTGWRVFDNMRGIATGGNDAILFANSANAEASSSVVDLTATGFQLINTGSGLNQSGATYIYIAIRRGPMKTPTSGTSVFTPTSYTGNGSSQTITTTIRPDFVLLNWITSGVSETFDRLRGNELLYTQANAAKDSSNQYISFANNTGFILPSSVSYTNASSNSYTPEAFTRAPSVIDVVCYTGTGAILNVSHNLTVAPEMMWVKRRDTTGAWSVYHKDVGNTKWANMSATSVPATSSNYWNNTTPTASVFTVGATGDVNASAGTYVAYLFATCPGVSKVGSYTGNGTNQTINCGFSSGARLIMIKRTDAVGSWYLWDSSRGIVSGNDPYIRLNDGAISTTTDAVDADNSGFIVNQESLNLNVNAATYIFWAVA